MSVFRLRLDYTFDKEGRMKTAILFIFCVLVIGCSRQCRNRSNPLCKNRHSQIQNKNGKVYLDGMAVLEDSKTIPTYDSAVLQKLSNNPTVKEVVLLLGPSKQNTVFMGTGSLRWRFDDGTLIYTRFFPESLADKVVIKNTTSNVSTNTLKRR